MRTGMRTDTLTLLFCQAMSTFTFFLFIHGSECFIDVFLIVFTFYTLSLVRLGRHNCLPLSPSSLGFLHIIYCAAIEFEFVDLLMGTANTNWAHVES